MAKENRTILKPCRFTKEENVLVDQNITKSKFKTYSEFVRFYTLSSIDGVFLKTDNNDLEIKFEIRNLVVAINRLNNNLNQIAKQVNTHTDKIDKIKFDILASINVIKEDSNKLKNEFLK